MKVVLLVLIHLKDRQHAQPVNLENSVWVASLHALLAQTKHVRQIFTRLVVSSQRILGVNHAQLIQGHLAAPQQMQTSPAFQTLPAPGFATLAIT